MWPKMWLSIFFGGGSVFLKEFFLWATPNTDYHGVSHHLKPCRFSPCTKKRDNEPRSFKRLLKESKIKSLATSYKCLSLDQKKLKKHWDISNCFSLQPWIPIFKKREKTVKKNTAPTPTRLLSRWFIQGLQRDHLLDLHHFNALRGENGWSTYTP